MSVQHEVPAVTDEVMQGTARDCNSRKTGNGANGQSMAGNSNVCYRSEDFRGFDGDFMRVSKILSGSIEA